eukprot:TRINITY_DN4627_c0_g3_i1.p1 TRINITY_DN4627_c0_g3~~TRINITY_DN4627_c0_g3_i1.p1  ORF type:complete len:481 (+),score=127.30 TRINITY_DN4627_c0_g3_i1:55-1497(+)
MVAQRLEFYYQACANLSVPPDPHVIATLKTSSDHLEVSKCSEQVAEGRWLALVEMLVSQHEQDAHHKHLTCFHAPADLRQRSVEPVRKDPVDGEIAIAYVDLKGYGKAIGCNRGVLLRTLLIKDRQIEELHLSRCGITHHAAKSLAEGLRHNSTLRVLQMKNNNIGKEGAIALAVGVEGLSPQSRLAVMDITNTYATFEGVTILSDAVDLFNKNRKAHAAAQAPAKEHDDSTALVGGACSDALELLCDRNFAKEEVANAVSHGLAVILCIVYATLLLPKAQRLQDEGKYLACIVFIASMMTCYLSSTLYHTFFMHKTLQRIFRILDHSSIFLLIAGTYTPVCLLKLGDTPYIWLLLAFQWMVCFVGVSLKAFGSAAGEHGAGRMEAMLFLMMGWSALFVAPQMYHMEEYCRNRIVLGGLAYTFGIFFFIRGDTWPMYHAVWHLFTIAGGLFHFLGIYEAVKFELALADSLTNSSSSAIFP